MTQDPPTTYRIALFTRKPRPLVFSIEHVFGLIRDHLPARYEPVWTESPHFTEGVVPRIRAVLWARRHQGDVNHVVGDIHFIDLLLAKRRTVLTIHDCEFLERAGVVKRWLYRWIWLVLPIARAGVVTVPARSVAEDLRRYARIDPARVRVIPDPVDPVFTREDRPFPAGEPLILQMGTRSNKNLERVIEALDGMACRLLVVGVLRDEQRDLLRRHGVEHEAAAGLDIDEVAAAYRRADLVVFASTKEGFGLPVIEAQASGRPVVTSNIPPMSDVAGEGAVLVDPFDVASIRDGIRHVIEDAELRQKIVAAGLANVRRFDPGAIAEAYATVYDEIVGSASRS
ncbi:MAG: glycosyltransferase family 1 protein [Actinomycetota bacterium]